jgi:hypothetical protein
LEPVDSWLMIDVHPENILKTWFFFPTFVRFQIIVLY